MPTVSANRPSNPTLTELRTWPAAKSSTLRASTTRTPSSSAVRTCGGRSSVAASLMRAQGLPNVSDLAGGYNACADAHAVA
jgi:rhodanese-related sulfurtransferase